jgi:sugar O-acyltransferase (sialic acid O-acetyltransferase NeuD family)
MTERTIVVIGAGGFAREVHWLIDEINGVSTQYRFLGYVVSDVSRLGEHDSPVLGDTNWLRENRARVDALAIGIGTPAARLKVPADLLDDFAEDRWPALVHPSVRIDRATAKLGPGVLLCAGVMATVNIDLRSHALINLSCTLGHECEIGEGSVLNPTVNISGGVKIGRGVLVGTGAQVLQYVQVGAGATIGAGAVVTKPVSPGVTVAGVPARPLEKK